MPPKKVKVNIRDIPTQREMMTPEDPVVYLTTKLPKFGTKYLIMPEDTEKKRKEKKSVKELTKYWSIEEINHVITNCFDFNPKKHYNIFCLTSDGWRDIVKNTPDGNRLAHNGVLGLMLDSAQNETENPYAEIFAIDITEY